MIIKQSPRITIIILNFNGWRDTVECLESLFQIDYSNFDVIVLDNCSSDDSILKIVEYAKGQLAVNSKFVSFNKKSLSLFKLSVENVSSFDKLAYERFTCVERLVLLTNKHNDGFAKGNNLAISFALQNLGSDYVLLLNNDTVVDRSFLREIAAVAESVKNVGIIGPKIYHYNYSGRSDVIYYAGEDIDIGRAAEGKRYGFNDIDRGQYNHIREVDKIDGACMLIKTEVFKRSGFLESSFFVYWEDSDFCYRVKKDGFKIVYVPTARLWHKWASTIGGINNPTRIYYYTRNRYVFLARNFRGAIKIDFLLYLLGYNFWLNIGYFIKLRSIKGLSSFLRGSFDGLRFFLNYK